MFEQIERFQDRLAVIESEHRFYSYRDLVTVGNSFVRDIPTRSLLFFVGTNTFESFACYTAAVRKRVVLAMIPPTIEKALFDHLLEVYKPYGLFLPAERDDLAWGERLTGRQRCSIYLCPDDIHAQLHDDLALILSTSGSTGSPKLVRLSEKNIRSNTEAIIQYLGIGEDDRAITTMPMTYSYGLSIINTHLCSGATVIACEAPLMDRLFWTMLKEEKATTFGGVPFHYEILKKLRFARTDTPTLKYLTQAGGHLTKELTKEFHEICAQKGIRFIVMYGQTEATARMSYLPYLSAPKKLGSIGVPIPGGHFSLEGTSGETIEEAEQPGELVYRGENVSMGYAESPADLARGDDNKGVLRTGDMARRDTDGFYYIVGRKKRFLKIFGNRVNLGDLEEFLKEIGVDAACAGRDDLVRVFMTDQDRMDDARAFLSQRTHIHPSAFDIVYLPTIPRNDSGKILYSKLPETGR